VDVGLHAMLYRPDHWSADLKRSGTPGLRDQGVLAYPELGIMVDAQAVRADDRGSQRAVVRSTARTAR
jgi:hypothetical protein